MVYIGIDLGTTNSCVAVVENDKSRAIHDDHGNYNNISLSEINSLFKIIYAS